MIPPLPPDLACPIPALHSELSVEIVSTGTVTSAWKLVLDKRHARDGTVGLPVLVG